MVMDNSMWTADDMTMVLFAMYRVLLQSRPDAPNELMLQIPITCSNLLPLLITQFVSLIIVYNNRHHVNYRMEML